MATVVNDRDVLIMSVTPRFAASTDRAFFVNPEAAIFKVTNGIASPSSFNFTPTLLNMAGTVSYVPSAGLAIAVSGNNFSLAYSDMTVAAGSVVATLVVDGVTYTRTIPVSRIVDGVAPKILDLAASSQVFKVDKAGVGSPGSIELIAYGQNLVGTPNFTIISGTATLAIGSDNTRKQLTFANMATDLVQVTVTQDGQTDTITIVKVREGADGSSATTAFLTNESQTVPANLDGTTISMAGASATMKVYLGTADDSANWTYTASPASSTSAITYTLDAASGVLTASALNPTVDSAYVDITAARQGYASVTKRFSIAKSKTGPAGAIGATGTRGNVNLSVITSGSIWSDAEANAAVLNMTGTSARSRDVVNLYRADRTWAQRRVFDGFNWSILADAFDGSILVKGSVLADAIDTRGLTVKDLDGTVLLGVGVPLAPSLAAAGTLNTSISPNVNNLSVNSLPYSLGNYSAGVSVAVSWSGAPVYAPAGNATAQYSPNNRGCVYVAINGTVPSSGVQCDLYDNTDQTKRVSVNAGDKYEFGIALSTHRCTGYVVACFYKADGTYITEFAGNHIDDIQATYQTHPGDAFPRSVVICTAPALTAKVMVVARMLAYGTTNPYLFSSEWYYGVAGSTQTVGTKYTDFSSNGLSAATAAAQQSANAAQATADAVNSAIANIASDSVLDPSEKASLILLWNTADSDHGTLGGQANVMGVDGTAFNTAYTNLSTYLTNIPGGWNVTTVSSPIVRADFNTAWLNFNTARQNIANAVAAMAATTATVDGLTGMLPVDRVPSFIPPNGVTNTMIGGNLFSANWAGPTAGPGAKGWLLERDTGSFYGYNAVLRGALMIGDYTGYAWPAAGGSGAYLGPGGLLLGNLNGNKYFQASADGDVYMPGLRVVNSQVYVDNPIITGGVLDAFYSNNTGGGINGSYANGGATYGTLSMNVVGGRAPFNYYWFINPGNASGTVKVRVSFQGGAPNAPKATILGSGTNDDLDGTVMCICIDANGRAVTAAFSFYVRHGVPP